MWSRDAGITLPDRMSQPVTSSGVLFADMDGDGVADAIECAEKDTIWGADITQGVWTLRRWAGDGIGGFGEPEVLRRSPRAQLHRAPRHEGGGPQRRWPVRALL